MLQSNRTPLFNHFFRVQRDRAPPSEQFLHLRTTELRPPTISMVQRDRAPPSERVSLNRPPALRLVMGESTGLFGFGLERFLRDQAKWHFASATSYSE